MTSSDIIAIVAASIAGISLIVSFVTLWYSKKKSDHEKYLEQKDTEEIFDKAKNFILDNRIKEQYITTMRENKTKYYFNGELQKFDRNHIKNVLDFFLEDGDTGIFIGKHNELAKNFNHLPQKVQEEVKRQIYDCIDANWPDDKDLKKGSK